MKLVKLGPPPWKNQDLTLFHGTLNTHVDSILAGIDPQKMDADADFGKGFYTTTNRIQARRFAEYVALRDFGEPAVIEFAIGRDELAEFEPLFFVLANRHSHDFWNLIESCRAYGGTNRGLGRWYDIVIGPVARNFEARRAWPSYDQISFHSDRVYELLIDKVVNTHRW